MMNDENSCEKYVNAISRDLGDKSNDLDADFSGEGKLHEGEEKLLTSEPIQTSNLCCVSDEKFSLLRLDSLELTELGSDVGSEKIVQELQNFLPKWVTREQVLDIISCNRGNVIEIVDYFYEHETKFYEQVSSVISITSGKGASVSELGSINCIPAENEGSQLTQFHKLLGSKSLKSSISPVKRNKKNTAKPTKKAKAHSKTKSTDSKQATITKFFNKVCINETKA